MLGESPGKIEQGKALKKRKVESSNSSGDNVVEVIVAARQDNILSTAFHPELTEDPRWHVYFTRMTEKFVDDRKKSK